MAEGYGSFVITQFALGDAEIDYNLWNPAHTLGTNYYGSVIEALPMIEAIPDETQLMKYKLVTLSKGTVRIPVVTVNPTTITATGPSDITTLTPNTINFLGANSTYGYTARLSDSTIGTLLVTQPVNSAIKATSPNWIGDNTSVHSISVIGHEFKFIPAQLLTANKTAQIHITGNETGGTVVVNVTVNKVTTSTGTNISTVE